MANKKKSGNSRGNNKRQLSKRQLTILRKETDSFTLRMAGRPFDDIAQRVGFKDASGAYRAYKRALNRIITEPLEEARLLELSRLDAISTNLFIAAREGSLGSIDRYLRVMERRSKLLGLDAPDKLEVDWRREAEDAGIEPSEIFEEMVNIFMKNQND